MCGHHRRSRRTITIPTTRAHDDQTRASDAEREQAMDRLQAHAAEGRLEITELEERLDRVLTAKTRADLDALLADLPRRSSAEHTARVRGEFREHLRSYLWVNALLVLIWALTDPGGYFWPVWPILGWGIGVASHASTLRSAQRVLPPPHASARA